MPEMPAVSHWYVLGDDGRTPVPCPDLLTLAKEMNRDSPFVAQDLVGDTEVSTVFLFVDHQYIPGGPPLLFETMALKWQRRRFVRYSTWEDAEAGHAKICELLETGKFWI